MPFGEHIYTPLVGMHRKVELLVQGGGARLPFNLYHLRVF